MNIFNVKEGLTSHKGLLSEKNGHIQDMCNTRPNEYALATAKGLFVIKVLSGADDITQIYHYHSGKDLRCVARLDSSRVIFG